MKISRIVLILLCIGCLLACEKDQAEPAALPLEERLPGQWLVIYHTFRESGFSFGDTQNGIVTHWGGQYIHRLSLHSDGTFYINEPQTNPAAVGESSRMGGRWELHEKQITFTWENGSSESFSVSISPSGILHLANSDLTLHHSKQN